MLYTIQLTTKLITNLKLASASLGFAKENDDNNEKYLKNKNNKLLNNKSERISILLPKLAKVFWE